MPAQVIFFEPPPALPNKLFSHGTGDFGRRYGVNLGNPWVCRASVGGGGAETDDVETVQNSIIGHYPASAIGRMLTADSIHPDQQRDGDDHDQNNY